MQVWKNFTCQIVTPGTCSTQGRLTPKLYSQMAAAVNVSYGLYKYGPFLADLQGCDFVRSTFTDIERDHCPGLKRYTQWIYVGLVVVSASVMSSLVFWVIYARERRHRVYTKDYNAMHSEDPRSKGQWDIMFLWRFTMYIMFGNLVVFCVVNDGKNLWLFLHVEKYFEMRCVLLCGTTRFLLFCGTLTFTIGLLNSIDNVCYFFLITD